MIAYLIRRALAALDGLRKSPPPAGTRVTIGPATFTWIPAGSPEWDEMIRNAQQCPDEIEPPESVDCSLADLVAAQELTTEVVLDLANERWFEHGAEDVAAWEREVRSDA